MTELNQCHLQREALANYCDLLVRIHIAAGDPDGLQSHDEIVHTISDLHFENLRLKASLRAVGIYE